MMIRGEGKKTDIFVIFSYFKDGFCLAILVAHCSFKRRHHHATAIF